MAEPCQTRGECGVGARHRRHVLQRGAELARPVDVFLAPQPPQQLVLLPLEVPLPLLVQAEEGEVGGVRALADDQFDPAAGELVEGGVVLGDPDRVQHGEDGDAGQQADAGGAGGERAEDGDRGRAEERVGVPLADRERVQAEAFGRLGLRQHVAEAVGGGGGPSGERVRAVADEGEHLESHGFQPAPRVLRRCGGRTKRPPHRRRPGQLGRSASSLATSSRTSAVSSPRTVSVVRRRSTSSAVSAHSRSRA